MSAYRLVLIRHGESQWNQQNRFTGWVDVDLSEGGIQEAKNAARLIRDEGYTFDVAYTSILKRAIRTLWLVQEELDCLWLPVTKSWRLNERHYGALQGLDKAETAARYGEAQVKVWRRSYDSPPPLLADEEYEKQKGEARFQSMPVGDLPRGETLKTTLERMLPLWQKTIAPQVHAGQEVLIVAHGNSLRALVQYLERLSNETIMELNIPTGVPLVYELNEDLSVASKRYLGDPEAVARAQAASAATNQKRNPDRRTE